ncbi:MAG: hypothetical protein M3Y23_06495 [Actinomycetota bacterium]|nr:hypothetical protein [Actinomycetota bacterium]
MRAAVAGFFFILLFGTGGFGLPGASSGEETRPVFRPPLTDVPFDKGEIDSDRCIARGDETRSVISRCTYGRKKSGRKVVLFGDSHALQYGPAMIRIAEKRGWRLIALTRQSCVAASVWYEPTCDAWREDALDKIRRIRPDLVVISTGTIGRYRVTRFGKQLTRRQSEPFLTRGMVRTLNRIRRSARQVAVIRDQSVAPFMPQDCLAEKSKEECGFRVRNRDIRGPFDAKAARRVSRVKLIDPIRKLCPAGYCPAVIRGNLVVYRDDYHLTATYAKTLAPWLIRRLPRLG